MQSTNWLLDSILEMDAFAKEHNLSGLVEGLGVVLENFAREAALREDQRLEVINYLQSGNQV